MKNIYLPLHIVTWDGRTKNLTKLQGEGQMLRKRLTPQVSDLICVCGAAGKFQTGFRAISPSNHQYLWKESEDRLSMVLTMSGKTSATRNSVVPPKENSVPLYMGSKAGVMSILCKKFLFRVVSVRWPLVWYVKGSCCRGAWLTCWWGSRLAIEFTGDVLYYDDGFLCKENDFRLVDARGSFDVGARR